MDKRTRAILADAPQRVDIAQHRRKCSVCRHPKRAAIEEAFLQWREVSNITREFHLPGRTALYRHARALGLFARRSRNLRFALGLIIEQAESVAPTAEAIVHAVRAYTRVTDAGEWVEPTTRQGSSSRATNGSEGPLFYSGERPPSAASSPQNLIATQTETGHAPTP
jgi:hypothetical protein